MAHGEHHRLIDRLDAFIRRYYVNELIRGALIFTGLAIGLFLFIVVAEYLFWFPSWVRRVLFIGFLAAAGLTLAQWVVRPVLRIYALGERIDHAQAARIIGNHFPEVEDKLLNILQLGSAQGDASLIEASIEQKTAAIRPVPFGDAIDLRSNRTYLKYALPPLLLLLVLGLISPTILRDGSERILRSGTDYERPAPFQFVVTNEPLQAVQYDDITIEVRIEGDKLPDEVRFMTEGYPVAMTRRAPDRFTHTITNLQDDVTFHLQAGDVRSVDHVLDVLAKPVVTDLAIDLVYPAYLGMEPDVQRHTGDLQVPVGTRATWRFETSDVDRLEVVLGDTTLLAQGVPGGYEVSKKLFNSGLYIVRTINSSENTVDSVGSDIRVIPDQYPTIRAQEFADSTMPGRFYYIGEAEDDHGIGRLQFVYSIERADSAGAVERGRIPIGTRGGQTIVEFTHFWSRTEFDLGPGDVLTAFFQVWDNDGVTGPKSARSDAFSFAIPEADSLQEASEQEFTEIRQNLDDAVRESQQLQQEMRDVREEMLEKKDLTWEDRKRIEDLMQRQQQFERELNQLNERMDRNMDQQSEFKEVSEEVRKKQEAVQKLFDEVLTDEMRALFEKMEEMLEELGKDEALEQMEEFEMTDETLEQELDRMKDLLERLEFEQKMEETMNRLEDLAQEQDDLARESRDRTADSDELKEKQDALNEAFEDVKEDLDELSEMGQEDMSDLQDQGDEVSDDMQNASDQLGDGQPQDASPSQQDAAQQMQEMSQSMGQMMMQAGMAQMQEDMEALRQLLENLVRLSFDQEQLMDAFAETGTNTPAYVRLVQEQFELMDDSKMVEDSLYALAARVFQIEAFVTEEIREINFNLDQGVDKLEERQAAQAGVHQQYAMTGYNNLALMLSEVMSQMQQQMAQQMQGSQMCQSPGNKPGGKGGKMSGMKSLQQQLNDQIEQMGEMMEKGASPGQQGMSERFAKMAAKQQAIRQALQEMSQDGDGDGERGTSGELRKAIDEMEQTEEELVNKQITEEMLQRQQDIMTRLLEAEDAEQQRDQKDERQSVTAQDIDRETPPSLEEYLKKREALRDAYRSVPPNLRPFYRGLAEKYFNTLSN